MGWWIMEFEAARTRSLWSVALALIAVQVAACGGGGGGGGGGGSSDTDLGVLKTSTFLSREAGAPSTADPRTTHQVQFHVSGLNNPDDRLTDAALEVRLNGQVDVEANVTLAADATVKKDITLILDVSASLTQADLAQVKTSAKDFVAEIVKRTDTLRIYEFASPSEIQLLGTYTATGSPSTGFAWTPSPIPAIDAIDGGSNSTALFEAVRRAIVDDPERDDILVLFSDGQENSSPEGAREEALRLIGQPDDQDTDKKVAVFSVGFGSVDPDEMRQLSVNGKFLGVRPSLVGLFDQVAREIDSIYTLVYDTPAAFGVQTLDVRITAEKRRVGFETSLLAGIDLARAAIVQFPTLPGSEVVLNDLRTTPPTVLAYTVAPLDRAVRREDGLLTFAVEAAPGCTSPACKNRHQGVFGAGAQDEQGGIYVPDVLDESTEPWEDAVTGEQLTFRGFTDQAFQNPRRRYRCAEVGFPGGTYYFAPEIGLVRAIDTEGNVIVELRDPPCLVDGFTGLCGAE